MPRRSIEVPLLPKLIRKVDEIITNSGMTRKSIIKGDTIEAYGEAGIKKFYIVQEDIIDDKAILVVDAINDQAVDIIINLVQTGIEDLYVEIKKKEKIEKDKHKHSSIETKVEKKCFACEGELVQVGVTNLGDVLRVKVMTCTKCNRVEFYKE